LDSSVPSVPLLLRTIHSAPLGLYALKPLVQRAVQLGYTTLGVADRESLSAAVELGALAEAMEVSPLSGMELLADPARRVPVILLALDSVGYQQLLSLFSALSRDAYRQAGLAGLLSESEIPGSGLACLIEPPPHRPDAGQPELRETWLRPLHALFEQLPQATFYLRLPIPGSPGSPPERMESLSGWAVQLGLAPIAMPVATFLDSADAGLYDLGRQYRAGELQAEGLDSASAGFPPLSTELFHSLRLRPAAEVEAAYAGQPSALGHARRLALRAAGGRQPRHLGEPTLRLERGFNPETYLWDQIQNAVERRRPAQVQLLRERLYEEFSALRRHDRVGLFLALYELFRRLPQPELVALPERMTRGLLCAYLLELTPFDPLAQGAEFEEDTVLQLRSPLVLHIPDGYQEAILEILSELFGEACLGVIAQSQSPPAAGLRALAAERGLERHPQAIAYLKRCAQAPSRGIRWVLAMSRPVAAELPCQPGNPPFPRWNQLALAPREALAAPGMLFDLAVDANRTRLSRLGSGGKPEEADIPGAALAPGQPSTLQEILPLLYPRYRRPVVWLAFRAMQPQSLSQLVATLALLELERRDRNGFLRSLRLRWRAERSPADRLGGVLSAEQGRQSLDALVEETQGLILFREQLPPLFESVFRLPAGSAAAVQGRVLAGGVQLLPADRMVREVMGLLENPEVTYPLTQLLSQLPRYLSSRQHCRSWAKTMLQFAAAAEENPLAFAREVLGESAHPQAVIPAVQAFLEKRGGRLLAPDINQSEEDCRIEGNALRLGFSLIANIGPVTSRHLVESRQEKPFSSPEDVLRRTSRRPVTRRVLRELVLCGAFDTFRDGHPLYQTRLEVLETVAARRPGADYPLEEDLQGYLFDLGWAGAAPDEQEQTLPREPAELVQEESRILGVPLSIPAGRNLAELLPFEPALDPPARHHWWLGREVLQAGVLRDVWPWLERDRDVLTLASLDAGRGGFWIVAAAHLRDRLMALAEAARRTGDSPLILALGRLGGRPKRLDRFTLGLLPDIESPGWLHESPHLYLYDFEPLPSILEGAKHWTRLEVQLAPMGRRLVGRLHSAIQPFRVEPRSLPGCRLKLQTGKGGVLPRSALRLEEMPLLPSHMLLRRIERLEGVYAARFIEEQARQPGLLF